MRRLLLAGLALGLSGCAIERIGPPGAVLTRAIRVKASDVQVYAAANEVAGQYAIVEDLFVSDDGDELPRVLEERLRIMAGARGANAIIMHPLNRRLDGTRIVNGLALDDPLKYYRATAIWMCSGPPPEKVLGTIGAGAN